MEAVDITGEETTEDEDENAYGGEWEAWLDARATGTQRRRSNALDRTSSERSRRSN